MWKDSNRNLIDRMLQSLVLPTMSPTLNNLAERFLLTNATPPDTANSKKDLTVVRAEKLLMLGDAGNAWKLVQTAKPDQVDEITLRLVAEAALNSSERDDVCTQLPDVVKSHSSGDWEKLMLVCQLRAEDSKAAQVTLDLLHTQGVHDDVYFELVEKNIFTNAAKKQLPRALTPLRPLTLALLGLAKLPLPNEVYARPEAALIPDLLKTKARDDAPRAALAERAAERGLITAAELAEVYKSVGFTPDTLSNATMSPESGGRLHALLYQAAMNTQGPIARVSYALKFLQTASPGLLSGPGGQVLVSMLGDIKPTDEVNPATAAIARIYLMGGKPEAALEWIKAAKKAAIGIPSVAAELQNIWPLMVFAGAESDSDYGKNLTTWLDSMVKFGDPKTEDRGMKERAMNILLLLDAAGFAVPEEGWARASVAPVAEKRQMAPAFVMERLRSASTANRRGETILFGLLAAGNVELSPLVMIENVRALRLVELKADAANLAREAAAQILYPLAKP